MATHAEILKQARSLAGEVAERGRRVALVSSANLDFVKPYLIVESASMGALIAPWTGPYGQLEQVVAAPAGPLWDGKPEVLVIVARAADLDQKLGHGVDGLAASDRRARTIAAAERLIALARLARERFSGPILVANLVRDLPALDAFDASQPDGFVHAIAAANLRLAEGLAALPDAHVFDYAALVHDFGAARFIDARLYALARVAVAPEAQAWLARRLARAVAAVTRPAKKCLVVDLDHTLWHGVLGDDGLAGIKLGDDHPGSAYKAFQRALRAYRDRGMLIAIASKNDELVVREALDAHPEMLLRTADFAAIQAHWEPKSESLRRIATQLNIGLDSLVFLDDNPVERAEVRARCPEVLVVDLPTDPLGYVAALAEVPFLDRPRVLAEDRRRAAMVTEDAGRDHAAAQAESVEDFLAGLKMVATVGRVDEASLDRVTQLIHKTNQFNLTTRRHALADVRHMAASPGGCVAWLRLADRFGDLGLVAVGIVMVEADTARIDTFLMSCRVMNRGVETAFLAHLLDEARALGARRFVAEHLATAKNGLVKDFYRDQGFAVVERDDGRTLYELAGDAHGPSWPAHIQRQTQKETP
jgi:FkbH-like protein